MDLPAAGRTPRTRSSAPSSIQPEIEYYVYGAVTAIQHVLPGLIERASGTILPTTGASSALVFPQMGNVGRIAPPKTGLRRRIPSLGADHRQVGDSTADRHDREKGQVSVVASAPTM
ncbi:hypothetical protein [Frankia sp. QA3]|uniref:hypothetical protein n=1 Tax=Frankia sp. QA3 TaxID=710111 RepID=UPI0002FEC847|nr:hypothetical protein [Frankia sp. QA3]